MENIKPVQEAPCVNACPVHINVPRYIRDIGEGRFDEALSVIREKLPFPSVCGRICFHPCEERCNGNHLLDRGPIDICALKRFVAERPEAVFEELPVTQSNEKRVAVIGSGPAGLTAAFYLRRFGYTVTVFEKLSEPGGMVRFGIPDYRLPKDILAREIESIKQIGVTIKTNTEISSPAQLLEEGYSAVFVAIGAHKSMKMGIEGESLPGVLDGSQLMRELNSGKEIALGEKVFVIGGGNAAIDIARCALRLRSKEVTVLYRRSREDMPAWSSEVEEALSEGVTIEFLSLPTAISEENGKLRMQCIRTRLGDIEESGKRSAEPIPGSEFTLEADNIICAVGQVPEVSDDFGLTVKEDKVIVDRDSLSTARTGIFAGGDAVSGPASVIEAIAAGRQAAISIDRYLGGRGEIEEAYTQPENEVVRSELQGFPVGDRTQMPTLPIDERLKDFSSVELGFDEQQAQDEARRCLRCDLAITVDTSNCVGCMICVMRCSLRFDKAFSPAAAKVKIIPFSDGRFNEISFTDECDTCGICARYCPHNAIYRGNMKTAEVK